MALVSDGREMSLGCVDREGDCPLRELDRILRLTLAAHRLGCDVRVVSLHRDLRNLAELAGVTEVLGLTPTR
jgi:hypothetical protein